MNHYLLLLCRVFNYRTCVRQSNNKYNYHNNWKWRKKEMYFDIQKGITFISGYDRIKKNTTLSLIFIESEYLSRVRKVRVDDMALGISILPLSTIFLLDFGTVPSVWYFGTVPSVWYSLFSCYYVWYIILKTTWYNY